MKKQLSNIVMLLRRGSDCDIILRNYPLDKTPCITIADAGGDELNEVIIRNEQLDDGLIEVHYIKYSQTAMIHIWVNSEDERDELINNVETALQEARDYNYKYCVNFDNGTNFCSTIESECLVLSDEHSNAKKNMCPNAVLYDYQNLLLADNVDASTIKVKPSFDLDELDKNPPVLHSVIQMDFEYYKRVPLGGTTLDDIEVN